MKREEHQTAQGDRFSALLDKSGMGPSEFARQVGNGTEAQHINNWRRRGVPAGFANLVAYMLRCRPEEISSIIPAPTRNHDASDQGAPQLTEAQQMVLAACEEFTPKQIVALTQAAAWISEGRKVTPEDIPNKKLPAAAEKSAKRMSQ